MRATLESLGGETPLLLAAAQWLDRRLSRRPRPGRRAGRAHRRAGRRPVLYVYLHDGDLFGYCYYRDGQVVDEHCSDPGYFEPVAPAERQRLQGRPELLVELLPRPGAAAQLEKVLHRRAGGASFALAGFALLAFARGARAAECVALVRRPDGGQFLDQPLGPLAAAGGVVGDSAIAAVRGPRPVAVRAYPRPFGNVRRERQRPARRATAYRQLQAEGLLHLYEVGKQGWFFHREPRVTPNRTGNGFFVTWTLPGAPALRLCTALAARRSNHARWGRRRSRNLGAEPPGRWLGLGDNGQPFHTAVWDVEHMTALLDEEGAALCLDFSPDEQRLLAVCRGEVTVFDLTGRASIGAGKPTKASAVAPSTRPASTSCSITSISGIGGAVSACGAGSWAAAAARTAAC